MTAATLAAHTAAAIARLKAAGIASAALDARLLIAASLGLDRPALLSQSERHLTADEVADIDALLERRARHESVARIIGQREFYGLPFGLNEATLEPRPDSETIITTALRLRPDAASILDLGTGSGCLLLALLHELPAARGLGVDLAPRAIAQARANAAQLGLADRAMFQTGDWLQDVAGPFDLVVSNPPYIESGALASLMPEVRDYDPKLALDGGADGLAPYRVLIPLLPSVVRANGVAVLEVGHTQADAVAGLFDRACFGTIETHADLGGHARCVSARRYG